MEKTPKCHPSILFGSFLGIGFVKPAPGTLGSLATLPLLYFCFLYFGTFSLWLITIIASIGTILAAPVFVKYYGKDPSAMVSDEVAGQALPFAILASYGYGSLSASNLLILIIAGFILFRFFDILKPLGINRIQNWQGGWGILADDLLAGLYTFFLLKIVILAIL